jgi:hypothetical protein
MRGTFFFVLVFFGTFVVAWVANWFFLSRLWSIGM